MLSELEITGDPDTAENVAYEARAGPPVVTLNPAYFTVAELEVANSSN